MCHPAKIQVNILCAGAEVDSSTNVCAGAPNKFSADIDYIYIYSHHIYTPSFCRCKHSWKKCFFLREPVF